MYDEGGHFDWHRDLTHGKIHHVTVLVALNTLWSDGGFYLRHDNNEMAVDMQPKIAGASGPHHDVSSVRRKLTRRPLLILLRVRLYDPRYPPHVRAPLAYPPGTLRLSMLRAKTHTLTELRKARSAATPRHDSITLKQQEILWSTPDHILRGLPRFRRGKAAPQAHAELRT